MGDPMTGEEFKAWRKRLGMTQARAAEVLGITLRGIQKREAGQSPINREADMACRYLEEHPEQLG